MEENIKQLKQDYKNALKNASSKEEKVKIKSDYKNMKRMLDLSNKIIEKDNKDMKKFDKVWDKLDKEYQNLGETPTFDEENEELNDNQQQFEDQKKHSDEVMKKADETIKQIDKKLAELEKKESLEKNKQDYIDWKDEVLKRINSEEYLTIEEAKKKAKTTIKNKNDLTSIWEKNKKYYVVLSKDREVAFRNNYKEVVKYYDLVDEKNNSINNETLKEINEKMEKNNMKIIKETRELISKGENGLTTKIKGLEVYFWGETLEEVSDEMIAFALDIVNAYQSDKEKYDEEALKEVKKYLNEDEEVDDSAILNQLGIPIIDVTSKLSACLIYGGVEEIGTHMPEVRLNRNLEVEEVALNG